MKDVLAVGASRVGDWTVRFLMAAALLAGISGCVARVGPPPHRYYYRTRLVYTAGGPIYVRERVYYDPEYDAPPPYAPAPVYQPNPTYRPAAPYQPAPDYQPAPAVESPAAAQLQPLVAPIALYADPLVAALLPAATYPQQLQEARSWLASYAQPPQADIDAQPWAPAVKALIHYPTVLTQLTDDMQWTDSLGAAYVNQPADVLAAIQQLRAQAIAQGNLVSTPQQVVVQDGGVISIQPANPEVVYVPRYDPVVVYSRYEPVVFAGPAYVTGPWLVNGIFWTGGVVFVGDWHGGYYYRDGHWGRDYAWRVDRDRYWTRDSRFGPAPRVERDRYVAARGVRGHEQELHRSMAEHSAQRQEIQRGGGHR